MSDAALKMSPSDDMQETVRLFTITGFDLLHRMVFQGVPDGMLDEKYPYKGEGQKDIDVLFLEGEEPPDIITVGEKDESDVFEERWGFNRPQPAKIKITCPQMHLHGQPQLMHGPWCDVCGGKEKIEIVVGQLVEYEQLCSVDECENKIDECPDHCSENDFDTHIVRKGDWHIDTDAGNDDDLVLRGECKCGHECRVSLDLEILAADAEWEDK